MADLSKGSILVTGAGGGIGTATVAALVAKGYHVIAGARSERDLAALDAMSGVHAMPLDVTDTESVGSAAEDVARATSGLHAVVNNAGIIVQGPVELVTGADLRRQFEVNVYGPVTVMQAFLPLLRRGTNGTPGRIVNISAATARVAVPFAGPISASKAALESLSDAARVELAHWKIPVVLLEFGAMATTIFDKAAATAQLGLTQAPPDRVALYGPALQAVAAAMAKLKPSPVDTAVAAVVEAVTTRKPKPRYTAGRDATSLVMLSRLPTGTRDRLLAGSLGLRGLPSASTPRSESPATSTGRR